MSSAELAESHIVYLSFDLCTHSTAVLPFLSFIKSTSQTSYWLNSCRGSNHHKLLIYIPSLRLDTIMDCRCSVVQFTEKKNTKMLHLTFRSGSVTLLFSISQSQSDEM